MEAELTLQGLASAVGLGLLIGVVRERAHPDPAHAVAGVRTHLLLALTGALGASFGAATLVGVLLVTGALAVVSYLRSSSQDPGITGEVAMPVTALLGALAQSQPALAAGLSVVVAAVLFAKQRLHALVRERVSEQELTDALLLAGAALVVLPLLPDQAVDPWGVLVPRQLWRIVVLILAVGMAGHILLRLVGVRWGLVLAGFLSGFASSTAAVASFGQRARAQPALAGTAATGALAANLGSLSLLAAVLGAADPALLAACALPLLAGAATLGLACAVGLRRGNALPGPPDGKTPRAFRLSHALLITGLIAVLLLASAWLHRQYGDAGALAAAGVVALAEIHAAAASLAQLTRSGELELAVARWGVVLILATSTLSKGMLALASGGRPYGMRVAAGLVAMTLGAAAANMLVPDSN